MPPLRLRAFMHTLTDCRIVSAIADSAVRALRCVAISASCNCRVLQLTISKQSFQQSVGLGQLCRPNG